jgi:peptide/nickel transport system substrate-binding protein
MFNPLSSIEQVFYKIRDFFWDYPDLILGERRSARAYFETLYTSALPYSHFVAAFFLISLVFVSTFALDLKTILRAKDRNLVEAVVMGVDENGNIQKLTKINPIIPSNVQIERDLAELIYEPLIRYEYEQSADKAWVPKVINVLAESVIKIREGADYQFNLRKNVAWHDGQAFTADDVIKTFDVISQIEDRNEAYIRAIKQLRWEKLDDYTIRVCTKGQNETKTCNQTQDNPIFSNFLELISIKIIPEHKTKDITPQNIDSSIPELFRAPIGTGKYEFFRIDNQSVRVVWNNKYYGEKRVAQADGTIKIEKLQPKITSIEFKLFKNIDDAIVALQNGSVHSFATISTQFKKEITNYPQIKEHLSPVLVNQYWAVYFNLRKDPSGKALGAEFFQDVNVRTAISNAINRQDVINNALQNIGEEAFGPIPSVSEYFNPNAKWKTYNPDNSRKLLEEAGWTIKPGAKYRTNKDGKEMSFSLYFVNSFDRLNVAKTIQRDLELIGIKVIIDRREQPGQDTSASAPDGWSLQEVNNQFLSPRLFDAILYGMNTFIDPDRFELFHSTQEKTGLNISGYVGSAPTVKVNENRKEGEPSLITVPKVDRLLEDTRRFDPEEDKQRRIDNYNVIQELIAEDSPVTFLYHPQFIYYANVRVKSVNFADISSLETRFRNIEDFELDD